MTGAQAAVDLLLVPYDDGRRDRRMGAGPAAILQDLSPRLRALGLAARETWIESASTEPLASAQELTQRLAQETRRCREARRLPIVLAGNCMATVGALAGCGSNGTAAVWLDAHGDLNTPATSASGFLDGMAAATLLGWCHAAELAEPLGLAPLDASRLLLVGARSLDPGEVTAIAAQGVAVLPPEAAQEPTARERLARFLESASDVYIHIDLDVLDPIACGRVNEFAAPDGLSLEQALRLVAEVAARRTVCGITLSAYDPRADTAGTIPAAASALAIAAVRARPAGAVVQTLIMPLRPEHWPAVEAIYAQGIATGNATFEAETPDWASWDGAHLAAGRLVAVRGGEVVGWAALSPMSARAAYRGVAEVSVYVAAASRGQGVGSHLLQALIAESERADIWTLQASVFPENQVTLRLHRACGFREVGRRERISRLAGRWRDTILLERRSSAS